jgi:threonine dehydratase
LFRTNTLSLQIVCASAGSFRELHSLLHPRNITEFSYRHNGTKIVSFQALTGKKIEEDKVSIIATLGAKGFAVTDLSDNEMAKSHARHLAGGRRAFVSEFEEFQMQSGSSSALKETENSSVVAAVAHPISETIARHSATDFEEVLYRFEFPEAPGALNKFLDTTAKYNKIGWNISLFHYRNHGHDFGRVLVGLEVKAVDFPALQLFLENLGYNYYDETKNTAYTQFLR